MSSFCLDRSSWRLFLCLLRFPAFASGCVKINVSKFVLYFFLNYGRRACGLEPDSGRSRPGWRRTFFFFLFLSEKKIILLFFVVRFWARAKTEEEAVWCEPRRPHQQLGKEDWGPLALCGPEISMPEQAGSCLLTCMNNRVPGPNTTRCCCSRVKVDGAESFTDSARFVSQPDHRTWKLVLVYIS